MEWRTMKNMNKKQDFAAAEAFMAAHARVLDSQVFKRLFSGGAAGPVRDAVAAYRNDDGGFGYGLEPDIRAAASQPAAVEMALRLMDLTDAWDEELVRDAIGWLVTVAPGEGGAAFVEPTVAGGPARALVAARRTTSRSGAGGRGVRARRATADRARPCHPRPRGRG